MGGRCAGRGVWCGGGWTGTGPAAGSLPLVFPRFNSAIAALIAAAADPEARTAGAPVAAAVCGCFRGATVTGALPTTAGPGGCMPLGRGGRMPGPWGLTLPGPGGRTLVGPGRCTPGRTGGRTVAADGAEGRWPPEPTTGGRWLPAGGRWLPVERDPVACTAGPCARGPPCVAVGWNVGLTLDAGPGPRGLTDLDAGGGVDEPAPADSIWESFRFKDSMRRSKSCSNSSTCRPAVGAPRTSAGRPWD